MASTAAGRHQRLERFDAVTDDPGEIHELIRAVFGASVRVERSDGRPASLRLARAAVAELGVQRVTRRLDHRRVVPSRRPPPERGRRCWTTPAAPSAATTWSPRTPIRAGLLYRFAANACAAFDLVPDTGTERPVPSRSLRSAVAHTEEHLAEPITVGDIAQAAGLSARGLDEAIRRTTGTTPYAHLRRARLDAARHDLLRAALDESVNGVARRRGFHHLGRFADVHRREFGELPGTTLDA